MSYVAAAALQAAVYERLTGEPDLAGVTVADAVPPGVAGGIFILIGPETASGAGDRSGGGAIHRFTISVISDGTGFLQAKAVSSAVSASLEGAQMTLSVGRLVHLGFERAVARRLDAGAARRIDLTFRARIEV